MMSGLSVGGAERDVARVAPHHLDDRDAAMALRRRPYPLDAGGGHEHGRRVARRHVVHDLREVEDRVLEGARL
jgi:hypothetical protein